MDKLGLKFDGFTTIGLYNYVRHPLMLGIIIQLVAAPRMTLNHAILSGAFIIWIWYAVVVWEEPKLLEEFPKEYANYQKNVPSIIPSGCPCFSRAPSKKTQ